jgi:hypothetical protein
MTRYLFFTLERVLVRALRKPSVDVLECVLACLLAFGSRQLVGGCPWSRGVGRKVPRKTMSWCFRHFESKTRKDLGAGVGGGEVKPDVFLDTGGDIGGNFIRVWYASWIWEHETRSQVGDT